MWAGTIPHPQDWAAHVPPRFLGRALTTNEMTKTFCGSTRRFEISARNLHAFLSRRFAILSLKAKELGFKANQRLNGGHSTAVSHHGNPSSESKQLAERWQVSEASLERRRSQKIGPDYLKLRGRVCTDKKTLKHLSRAA